MNFPNTQSILQQIRAYLEKRNFRYTLWEDRDVIHADFAIRGRIRGVHYEAQVYDKGYNSSILFPINAKMEDKRELLRVLDLMNRINYTLREGNLEMDPEDGELRYRYYADCAHLAEVPEELIRKSIRLPLEVAERYGEGLVQVLLNDMDPERAFRMSRREDPEEAPEDEDTGCGDWPETEEEDLPEEENPDIRRVTRDMDALLERLRNTALEEDE